MVGRTVAALLLFAGAAPAAGQEVALEIGPDVPPALGAAIEAVAARDDATVFAGDTTIAAGATHAGSWVQAGGSLVLDGGVTGDVVAIDADVTLRPSAELGGDLTIVGGRLYGTTMATIRGRRTWLRDEPVTVVAPAPGRRVVAYRVASVGFPLELKGFAGIAVYEYNGVDGLLFGLAAGLKELPGQPPTELAFGPVFRTARDDVGWDVRGSRAFPRAGIVVGGRVYRVTDTPERWHRGRFSNSLASLFLADDDRTYFERTGYEAWIERGFVRVPLTLRVRWRDDEFDSLASERPFSFFGEDVDWRSNPPIVPGRGREIGFVATWDRRDDPEFPIRGAWVAGEIVHVGFGGDLEHERGRVDARAYVPLPTSAGSFAAVRAVAGGRLGDADTLAPQYRLRLGGGSSIPGYDALEPILTGDRMAFATATVHQALPSPIGFFERMYLVVLGSAGDAWFEGDDVAAHASLGAGLAGRGRATYAAAVASYGFDIEEWQLYFRLKPWF